MIIDKFILLEIFGFTNSMYPWIQQKNYYSNETIILNTKMGYLGPRNTLPLALLLPYLTWMDAIKFRSFYCGACIENLRTRYCFHWLSNWIHSTSGRPTGTLYPRSRRKRNVKIRSTRASAMLIQWPDKNSYQKNISIWIECVIRRRSSAFTELKYIPICTEKEKY